MTFIPVWHKGHFSQDMTAKGENEPYVLSVEGSESRCQVTDAGVMLDLFTDGQMITCASTPKQLCICGRKEWHRVSTARGSAGYTALFYSDLIK